MAGHGKPSASGRVLKRQMPLLRKKRIMRNGIWLFAGEDAFCKRKPLPQMRNLIINEIDSPLVGKLAIITDVSL
jgi:hypothetical protein